MDTVTIPPAFLERARREAERYGDDPWVLLRELVQNSRDAGASRIEVRVSSQGGTERLTCEDDGAGMSRDDITGYLLRLYASGKAGSDSAEARARGPIGRFGVGFWSVLRFSPALVRVESSTGSEQVAFEVDCIGLQLREVPSSLATRGTRVTLLRPRRDEPVEPAAERGLRRWAAYVRAPSGGRTPALLFNGRPMNRRFEPSGFVAERLKGQGFEGVVGLGPRPSVRLYAHGLLIREAGSLEELLPKRAPPRLVTAPGLYPTARINADGLEVLLDRQTVVEDRLLESIVATCERRVTRLARRLVDDLAPLPLLDRARLALTSRAALVAGAVLVTAGLGVGAGFLTEAGPGPLPALATGEAAAPGPEAPGPTGAARRAVESAVDPGQGPRINAPPDAGAGWDLRVRGDGRHLLKMATYARYDRARGLVADPVDVYALYAPWGGPHRDGLAIEIGVSSSSEPLVLPVPTGHRVLPRSVTLDGRPVRGLGESEASEPVLFEPRDGGRLRYETVETGPRPDLRPPAVGDFPSTLPPIFADALWKARRLPVRERALALTRAVTGGVRYSTSPDDGARFDAHPGAFVERVAALRTGDCDVMNALNVLLLRAAGIPARLAVGFVVEDGAVAPELHAWTEYYDAGWRVLDASPSRPDPASARVASADADAGTDDLDDKAPLVAPTRQRLGLGLAGAALLLASLGGVAALRRRRQRRARSSSGPEDDALVRMLRQFLKHPSEGDPLLLRRRPFFPCLDGSLLSLGELERLSQRGRLVVARRSSALLSSLARGLPVLDGDAPRTRALEDRLPERVDLDELARLAAQRASDPALGAVEQALWRLDRGVRIHAVPGERRVLEVEIPARRGALAPRHLLVGLDAPEIAGLRARYSEAPRLVTFELARLILDSTTLYASYRDELLAPLAAAAIEEGAP